MFKKHTKLTLLALLAVIFCLWRSVNVYGTLGPSSESAFIDPKLQEKLKSLDPSDIILVWIDVQARVDRFNNLYLPEDPAVCGIRWILITFDPKANENHLFWVLAEVRSGKVQEISEIPWVRKISLVKTGGYTSTRLSGSPKFAMHGMEYMFQRAIDAGDKWLEVVVYVENQTTPTRERLRDPNNDIDAMLKNTTAWINHLGGQVLNIGPYKNKLVARISPQSVDKIADNLWVSSIYPRGPVIYEGKLTRTKAVSRNAYVGFMGPVTTKVWHSIIFGAVIDLVTIDKKTRRRRLTLYIVTSFLLSIASFSVVPSAYALDISTTAIRANDVWNSGNKGAGVVVAVIDTGIDYSHHEFPGNAIVYNFTYGDPSADPLDTDGHGTHVAGIIAGRGIVNPAFTGVAPEARLVMVMLRPGHADDLDDAINWVRDNRDIYNITVLSLSVAAPGFPTGEDGSSVYSRAVDDAIEAGIVVVKSAGNQGPGARTITTPGDAFNVITVGASNDHNTQNISDDTMGGWTQGGQWRDLSSRGPTGDGRPKPDVVAPGYRIISTRAARTDIRGTFDAFIDSDYVEATGTSFAAPHVAGTVALMLHANPNLTPAQVKAILRQTGRLNDNLTQLTVNDRGHGIIDAYAAVQLAQNIDDIAMYLMYDSFDVSTPNRDLGWWCYDNLTFTVDGPSMTYGINLRAIDYHYRHPLGIGNTDYRLLHRIGARHIWIDDTYYNLGSNMRKYLFSGPRIYEKGDGYVKMQALYQVGDARIMYYWKMHVDQMWLWLNYSGGSSWKTLIYFDTDVWDTTNYPYLPETDETIYYEGKVTSDALLNIRDLDHTEYVKIDPLGGDDPVMWILRYPYSGNNPDSALNDEYTYNRDIIVYYQGTSFCAGPDIYRGTDTLPGPNPPPATPSTPSGPTSGYTHTTYTYTTNTTDPEDDYIHYQFDWGDESRDWTGWYASGANASASHYWTSPGTYYVRVRAEDSNDAWSDWSSTLTVTISSGGGGGCPYVSTWDGTEYVLDNNLLIASEHTNGDVVDYYRLEQPLVPNNDGTYSLQLSEFESEHDYLDQAQLLAVDHQSGVKVAVSRQGEILTYKEPYAPKFAIDENGRNVKHLISFMDENYYEGYNGSHITLNFGNLDTRRGAKLVVRADPRPGEPPTKESIHIQIRDENGDWEDVASFIPRVYWSIDIVNLSEFLEEKGRIKIRLYFTANHRIDYVGLDTSPQATISVYEGELISATHSITGDVKTSLLYSDDIYAEMVPGESIDLTFTLQQPTMEARDYIIILDGHYHTIST
jgi:serine protease AprX